MNFKKHMRYLAVRFALGILFVLVLLRMMGDLR